MSNQANAINFKNYFSKVDENNVTNETLVLKKFNNINSLLNE